MSSKEALDALETSCWMLASTIDDGRNRLFRDIADYWQLRELAIASLTQVRQMKHEAGVALIFPKDEPKPRGFPALESYSP